jgi:hypothetical protein
MRSTTMDAVTRRFDTRELEESDRADNATRKYGVTSISLLAVRS